MQDPLNLVDIQAITQESMRWVQTNILSIHTTIQLAMLVVLLLITKMVHRRLVKQLSDVPNTHRLAKVIPLVHHLLFPLIGVVVFGIYNVVASIYGLPNQVAAIITSLLIAWSVISTASFFLDNGYVMRWIKITVIGMLALHMFGALGQTIELLDGFGVTIGDTRITLYTVLKGSIIFAMLWWITSRISKVTDKRIKKAKDLTPSLKVLFSKVTKITLFTLTILIGLNAIGLDLTAFAVFGGALGVGLGFGLQKVVSNFISGIILLTDRSIKPGDVIAVDDTYGWVNALGLRYVSIITRDGKEHLIPNEQLITQQVENWSFTDNNIRIRIPVGVSYNTDLNKAMDLIVEAANDNPRALKQPEARCLVRGFGDSSVDLELRVWVNDPVNGMGNIQSEILLAIWHKFHEHDIEIPFPQRDIHIKSGAKEVSC